MDRQAVRVRRLLARMGIITVAATRCSPRRAVVVAVVAPGFDPAPLELRQDGKRDESEDLTPYPGFVDQVGAAQHHEAHDPGVGPGHEREAAAVTTRGTDRRDLSATPR
jgi:hypothetical protein